MIHISLQTKSTLGIALLLLIALAMLTFAPVTAWSCSGGDSGGGGGDIVDQYLVNKPGKGNSGNGGKWSPPGGAPPPPDNGGFVIDLDIPIRLEPVANNEVVDLVEIGPGIGGHPGSGRFRPGGPVVLVNYRDITKIVYDKEMGWVGITARWSFKIKLPMTPFIQQLITTALRGR